MICQWVEAQWKQLGTDSIIKGFRENGYIGYTGDTKVLHSRLQETLTNRRVPENIIQEINDLIEEFAEIDGIDARSFNVGTDDKDASDMDGSDLDENDGSDLDENDGGILDENDGGDLDENDGTDLDENDGTDLDENDGTDLDRDDESELDVENGTDLDGEDESELDVENGINAKVIVESGSENESDGGDWIKHECYYLKQNELLILTSKEWLNDDIMAQILLSRKFGNVHQSVLYCRKPENFQPVQREHLQLMHDGKDHWVLVFCSRDRVQVCDSLRKG